MGDGVGWSGVRGGVVWCGVVCGRWGGCGVWGVGCGVWGGAWGRDYCPPVMHSFLGLCFDVITFKDECACLMWMIVL